ncbi:MAG: phospholipase D-like domain-containing protein, partial [Oscillospiraceae bacterium]
NEMINALKIAVQSGVEVKIITPHIPDKWYVHTVTKSNYPILVQAGIKIYEFTPGFIHSKMIIADDVVGIVGTTNFDFRSFYLHFENGIFMYKSKAISQVKADFENILSQSSKITPEMCCNVGFWKQFAWSFMKLFSPFL